MAGRQSSRGDPPNLARLESLSFLHLPHRRNLPAPGEIVLRYSALLLSAVTLASAGVLGAQEIKPRSGPRASTDRLPRPAAVSAAQQPDGRIRVVWRAVDGAARYKVVRSVPPAVATSLTLPNPGDTQYVDADVKAGNTYYYVVSAINEAGIEGIKAGASVKAAAVVAPADTTPPLAAVAPPTEVVVRVFDYLRPQVSWKNSVPGARFIIERREDDGSNPANVTWKEAVALIDKPWPCASSCQITEDPRPIRRNTTSQYRVTTVEAPPSTRRSQPATSNTVLLDYIPVAPAEIHQIWLVKGESQQLKFRPGIAGVQYVSLDSNTVSVPNPGVVRAKEWGSTYIAAFARDPEDGSLKQWIWQARVGDKPQ